MYHFTFAFYEDIPGLIDLKYYEMGSGNQSVGTVGVQNREGEFPPGGVVWLGADSLQRTNGSSSLITSRNFTAVSRFDWIRVVSAMVLLRSRDSVVHWCELVLQS